MCCAKKAKLHRCSSRLNIKPLSLYLSCTSVSKAVTPHAMLLLNDIMVFSGASWTQWGQMGETHSCAWTLQLPLKLCEHTTPYNVLNWAYWWPRTAAQHMGPSHDQKRFHTWARGEHIATQWTEHNMLYVAWLALSDRRFTWSAGVHFSVWVVSIYRNSLTFREIHLLAFLLKVI